MAFLRVGLFFFVFVHFILLVSYPVLCDDEEDHLLQGLNSYRQSHHLPALTKNDKADCLAEEVADQMEDQTCTTNAGPSGATGSHALPRNYTSLLSKCKIDPNTTNDGAILPVCVRKRVATLVLTNYTQTQYARFLNDSKYVGAGVGSDDDWMVVVLTTNTHGGSFASEASLVGKASLGSCLWYLLLVFVVSVAR